MTRNKELLAHSNHLKTLYIQMFRKYARQYGLTQVEIDVLLFLHNNPGYNTARDISVIRGIAKSNVSIAVEALKKRGLLDSEVDGINRKLHRLKICPAAAEMLQTLVACQESCVAAVMEGFTEQEMVEIRKFQKRMDDNVTAALQRLEDGGAERRLT